MNVILNSVRSITRITSWIGLITLFLLMIFMPIGVASRGLNYPLTGDMEIIQLSMVLIIMFGLAFTQAENAHLAIGLIVDRLSPKIQTIIDVAAYTLTMAMCWTISFVFIGNATDNMLKTILTTDLLNVPFYPFKFCIAIGFFLWGLEALLKVIVSIQRFINDDNAGLGKSD